jgi:hypothetical protein
LVGKAAARIRLDGRQSSTELRVKLRARTRLDGVVGVLQIPHALRHCRPSGFFRVHAHVSEHSARERLGLLEDEARLSEYRMVFDKVLDRPQESAAGLLVGIERHASFAKDVDASLKGGREFADRLDDASHTSTDSSPERTAGCSSRYVEAAALALGRRCYCAFARANGCGYRVPRYRAFRPASEERDSFSGKRSGFGRRGAHERLVLSARLGFDLLPALVLGFLGRAGGFGRGVWSRGKLPRSTIPLCDLMAEAASEAFRGAHPRYCCGVWGLLREPSTGGIEASR